MIQTIITYAIVLIAFLIVAFKFYKLLIQKNNKSDGCSGCSGCDLKNEIRKNLKQKEQGCNDHKQNKK